MTSSLQEGRPRGWDARGAGWLSSWLTFQRQSHWLWRSASDWPCWSKSMDPGDSGSPKWTHAPASSGYNSRLCAAERRRRGFYYGTATQGPWGLEQGRRAVEQGMEGEKRHWERSWELNLHPLFSFSGQKQTYRLSRTWQR